jgi:hypothetical protein
MAKEARKKEKAIKKLDKAVRKAVDKGVSQSAVENTVEKAMAKTAKQVTAKTAPTTMDDDPGTEEVTAKAAKLPGLNKHSNIVLKRGFTKSQETVPTKRAALNTEPMIPDSEKPSLKKLPGKRKPPTLTLKRDKNS